MTHTDGLNNVETIINRFGGMRPMARKLDVAVSTIQGWKKRDNIPADRVEDVISAAEAYEISIDDLNMSGGDNDNATATQKITTETPQSSVSSASSSHKKTSPQSGASLRPKSYDKSKKSKTVPQSQIDLGQLRSATFKRSMITTVSIVGLFFGVGYFLFAEEAKEISNVANNQYQIEKELSQFQTRYTSLENTITNGLNSLSDQVTNIAATVGVERQSDGNIVVNQDMPLSQRLMALESRLRSAGDDIDLGQLVSNFETLGQNAQASQGQTTQAMNDLRLIIDGVQSRMGAFEIALSEAKANNAQLAQSMENVTGRDLGAAAMLLAMTQMRDTLNRSQPFAQDLAVLQELVGSDDPALTASINRLAPYAQSGVLTPEGLSSEFRGITGEIVSAALRGENVSIQDKIMGRLGQILSVQKNGEPLIGIKEQTIIARAQNALDNGNVKAAMAELNKLEGDAALAADPFKYKAQGVLNADQAVSGLMNTILEKIQNPQELKGFMQNLPKEINNQMQGEIVHDPASGLIILE